MTAIMNTLNFSVVKNAKKAREFFKMAERESLVYFKSPDGCDVVAINKKNQDGGYKSSLPVWLFCDILNTKQVPTQELINFLEYKGFCFEEEIQSISVFNKAQRWAREQKKKRRELEKKRAYTCQKSCRWINPDGKEYTCLGKIFYCEPGKYISEGRTQKQPVDWLEYEKREAPKKFWCREVKEICQKNIFLAGRVFSLKGRRFVCGQSRGEGVPPARWETTGGEIKPASLLGVSLADVGVTEEKPTPAEYLLARTESISLVEKIPEKEYHISVRGVFDRINGVGNRIFTDGKEKVLSVTRPEDHFYSNVEIKDANWVVNQRWRYGGERWNTEVVVKEEWLKRQCHDSADFQGLIRALEVDYHIVKKFTVWDIVI